MATNPQRTNPFSAGLGFDPARDPNSQQENKFNTRVELPRYNYEDPNASVLPDRPGYNSQGKVVNIRVNQFKVQQAPINDVYQYDIHIGNGAEKRGLIKKVWESRTVQNELKKHSKYWLWDGNKIAWAQDSLGRGEVRIMVDLDEEEGKPMERRKEDRKIYCNIKQTTTIRMAALHAYLNRQMDFDNTVLCALNFLDHMLRQWPSESYTVQKRSFFARAPIRNPLDNYVEAMKGVYQSIRLCNHIPEGNNVRGLAINVDVANGTFWTPQDVHQAARNLCGERNRALDYNVFRGMLLPKRNQKGGLEKSNEFKTLERMKKLKFIIKHRGKEEDPKIYQIKRFTWSNEERYAKTGVNAKTYMFTPKNGKEISVYSYFQQKYNISLQHWYLPLIETERAGQFPMEVCRLITNQKYQYKLSPDQTAAMIKFAVTRPKARLDSIQHGLSMLKWSQDHYLAHFGCKIEPTMTVTSARVLQNPSVQFDKPFDPKTSGRWDLRGKKFLLPNPEPLKAWSICVVGKNRNKEPIVDEATVKNFINTFVQTYIGHGGKVINKTPPITYSGDTPGEIGAGCEMARNAAGRAGQQLPQIVLFVLPGRDSHMYERLKKNMDCRFGMVSQCLNIAHVVKASPQYCSNVCMKVNAKLGGTTSRVADSKPPKPFFPRSTMVIGADVSHAAPGSPQASMAALTMSMDTYACRYAAAVQTNGSRVEMITRENIKGMMIPLFRHWIQTTGKGAPPAHIYYFRDGVSEGQFAHVLDDEVKVMKQVLDETWGERIAGIKWTVTVCTKRHHLRFFPKEGDKIAGDQNGNAIPGTLVERDITHPFEYDFYLSSHSAIQGTARPVHYQVIMDEAKVPVNDFQRMIYQHCYQYMRSTTPVSLYPAVYYAHLASNRARAHEAVGNKSDPRGGEKFEENQQDRVAKAAAQGRPASSNTGSKPDSIAAEPLLPLGVVNPATKVDGDVIKKMALSMWYI